MQIFKKVTNYQIEISGTVYGETMGFPNRAVKITCYFMPRGRGSEPTANDFYGHTISNNTGYFRYTFDKEDLKPGIYRFRFYGTGHRLHPRTKEHLDDFKVGDRVRIEQA